MSAEHEKFGSTITGSRWFRGEPKINSERMVPFEEHWLCPMEGCGGEMKFNGMKWPTGDPGYHHSCTLCGFNAAIHGKRYPRVVYRPASQEADVL